MRNKIIFILALLGVAAGLAAAWFFGIRHNAQPPAFSPVSSPFISSIYANGIIESDQASGSNITVYPEVSGIVTSVSVREGERVKAGSRLVNIDDAAQRASTDQLRLQAAAAKTLFEELRAQPRPETLHVAQAQVDLTTSSLALATEQYKKRRTSFGLDARSISQETLDNAANAVAQASAAQQLAQRQLDLIRAGAWHYDLAFQKSQAEAAEHAYQSALAVLAKYAITARVDGVVLAVNTTPGSTVSPAGAYNPYTQALDPVVVMSGAQDYMVVRCYVDEILVSRLPRADRIQAQMAIRGTDVKVALQFVRVQPYVTPKIELSDQRQERVDLRVLPVLFRFKMEQPGMAYPGQLVDVYIGEKR